MADDHSDEFARLDAKNLLMRAALQMNDDDDDDDEDDSNLEKIIELLKNGSREILSSVIDEATREQLLTVYERKKERRVTRRQQQHNAGTPLGQGAENDAEADNEGVEMTLEQMACPEVALDLNRLYQQALEQKIDECQEALVTIRQRQLCRKLAFSYIWPETYLQQLKQVELKSQLTDRSYGTRADRNMTKKSKKNLTVYSRPYFKDANGMCPPPNEDTIKKQANGELDPYEIKAPKPWSLSERTKLRECVKADRLQAHLRPCMNRLEIKNRKLKAAKPKSEEEEKLKNEVHEIKQEMESIKENTDITFMYGSLEDFTKIDWMKISNIDFDQTRTDIQCKLYWKNAAHPLINSSKWSQDESDRLVELVAKYEGVHWEAIANELATSRTAFMCLQHYQTKLNPCLHTGKWLPEEDALLTEMVTDFGRENISWSNVAYYMEGRSREQCSKRWEQLNPQTFKRGRWTQEEDEKLEEATKRFGTNCWWKVKDYVPGRSSAQCRERWSNTLDRSIVFSSWSRAEDKKLWRVVKMLGEGHWQKIASSYLKGRTDNMCLQRYRRLQRWKIQENLYGGARKARGAPMPRRAGPSASLDTLGGPSDVKTGSRFKPRMYGSKRLKQRKDEMRRILNEAEQQVEVADMERTLSAYEVSWQRMNFDMNDSGIRSTMRKEVGCRAVLSTPKPHPPGSIHSNSSHSISSSPHPSVNQSPSISDRLLIQPSAIHEELVRKRPRNKEGATSDVDQKYYNVISTVRNDVIKQLNTAPILKVSERTRECFTALPDDTPMNEMIEILELIKVELGSKHDGSMRAGARVATKQRIEDEIVEWKIARLLRTRRLEKNSSLCPGNEEADDDDDGEDDDVTGSVSSTSVVPDEIENKFINMLSNALKFHSTVSTKTLEPSDISSKLLTPQNGRLLEQFFGLYWKEIVEANKKKSTFLFPPNSNSCTNGSDAMSIPENSNQGISDVESHGDGNSVQGKFGETSEAKKDEGGGGDGVDKKEDNPVACPLRASLKGKDAANTYIMPPLPPNVATMTALRAMLLDRPRLVAIAGRCHKSVILPKKTERPSSAVASSSETAVAGMGAGGDAVESAVEEVEGEKQASVKRRGRPKLKQINLGGRKFGGLRLGIGRRGRPKKSDQLAKVKKQLIDIGAALPMPQSADKVVHSSQEGLALMSILQSTHDFSMFHARFNSLFLWPALLATVPVQDLSSLAVTNMSSANQEPAPEKEVVHKKRIRPPESVEYRNLRKLRRKERRIDRLREEDEINDDEDVDDDDDDDNDADDDEDDDDDECPRPAFRRRNRGPQSTTARAVRKKLAILRGEYNPDMEPPPKRSAYLTRRQRKCAAAAGSASDVQSSAGDQTTSEMTEQVSTSVVKTEEQVLDSSARDQIVPRATEITEQELVLELSGDGGVILPVSAQDFLIMPSASNSAVAVSADQQADILSRQMNRRGVMTRRQLRNLPATVYMDVDGQEESKSPINPPTVVKKVKKEKEGDKVKRVPKKKSRGRPMRRSRRFVKGVKREQDVGGDGEEEDEECGDRERGEESEHECGDGADVCINEEPQASGVSNVEIDNTDTVSVSIATSVTENNIYDKSAVSCTTSVNNTSEATVVSDATVVSRATVAGDATVVTNAPVAGDEAVINEVISNATVTSNATVVSYAPFISRVVSNATVAGEATVVSQSVISGEEMGVRGGMLDEESRIVKSSDSEMILDWDEHSETWLPVVHIDSTGARQEEGCSRAITSQIDLVSADLSMESLTSADVIEDDLAGAGDNATDSKFDIDELLMGRISSVGDEVGIKKEKEDHGVTSMEVLQDLMLGYGVSSESESVVKSDKLSYASSGAEVWRMGGNLTQPGQDNPTSTSSVIGRLKLSASATDQSEASSTVIGAEPVAVQQPAVSTGSVMVQPELGMQAQGLDQATIQQMMFNAQQLVYAQVMNQFMSAMMQPALMNAAPQGNSPAMFNPATMGNPTVGNFAAMGNPMMGNFAAMGNPAISNFAAMGNPVMGNLAAIGNPTAMGNPVMGNMAAMGSPSMGNLGGMGNPNMVMNPMTAAGMVPAASAINLAAAAMNSAAVAMNTAALMSAGPTNPTASPTTASVLASSQANPVGFPQSNPVGFPQANTVGFPQANPMGFPQANLGGFPQGFPSSPAYIHQMQLAMQQVMNPLMMMQPGIVPTAVATVPGTVPAETTAAAGVVSVTAAGSGLSGTLPTSSAS